MQYIRPSREDLYRVAQTKDVVFFGLGLITQRFINEIDLPKPASFIVDNDPREHGTLAFGLEVKPPDALKGCNPENTLVIVMTYSHIRAIFEQVSRYGDFDVFSGNLLFHDIFGLVARQLYDNQEKIKQICEQFCDDQSKHIYLETIRRRIMYGKTDFSDLVIKGDVGYLLPQMFSGRSNDEVVIDCGAFTGDTLKKFATAFGRRLKRIFCFECSEENLPLLRALAARMRNNAPNCPDIVIMPYGCSYKEQSAQFYQTSQTSDPGGSFVFEERSFAKGNYDGDIRTVKLVALDETIPKDEQVTLIKMDIEGSEYSALMGARELIKRCRPRLAISLYHSGLDYYRIPALVKELVPEYRLAVRHHKKGHDDTDLYAWI
jgi:FkbM family methyltransferase